MDVQTGDVIGGGITLKIPLGKTNKIDCTKTTLFLRMRCERIVHTPGKTPVPAVTHEEKQQAYFLFPYAKPDPVTRSAVGVRERFPRRADNPELALQELAAQGFRVSSIQGFTSPEGPRDEVKGSMGNDELGIQRAATAKKWLEEHCPGAAPETWARKAAASSSVRPRFPTRKGTSSPAPSRPGSWRAIRCVLHRKGTRGPRQKQPGQPKGQNLSAAAPRPCDPDAGGDRQARRARISVIRYT